MDFDRFQDIAAVVIIIMTILAFLIGIVVLAAYFPFTIFIWLGLGAIVAIFWAFDHFFGY